MDLDEIREHMTHINGEFSQEHADAFDDLIALNYRSGQADAWEEGVNHAIIEASNKKLLAPGEGVSVILEAHKENFYRKEASVVAEKAEASGAIARAKSSVLLHQSKRDGEAVLSEMTSDGAAVHIEKSENGWIVYLVDGNLLKLQNVARFAVDEYEKARAHYLSIIDERI